MRRHGFSFLRNIFLAAILVLLAAGCGKSGNGADENIIDGAGKGRERVTFIELGSVNCIPCRMMQPIMREIEKEYGGQVRVVFYDVWTDAGAPYARHYGIRAIPTQVFLDSEGREYFRHEGFFPMDGVIEVLKQKGVK